MKTMREWFREQGIEYETDGNGKVIKAWQVKPEVAQPAER